MAVFLAVIDDLFQFARTSLFGVFIEKETFPPKDAIAGTLQQISLGSSSSKIHETKKTVGARKEQPLLLQGALYFIQSQCASLYIDPVVAFDSVIAELSYGEQVHVLKFGGRWAQVSINGMEGWVLKDVLCEKATDVFPVFFGSHVYGFDDVQTHKVRMCIKDMYGGESSQTPLCDVEYVTYKLFKKGRKINWPNSRPRTAGTWQKKLRGKQGIYIGITAKTDSVMEYVVDDQGHLCFVEAVFPDESIKLSGIDLESTYTEKMLSKDEWKELRTVFIEIM